MRGRSERGRGGVAGSSGFSGSLAGSPVGAMIQDVLYGALVAAAFTALSFILALAGFGRLYYVGVFLPFFMLACLLVAWFLYLKDDGFIPSARASGTAASDAERHGSPSSTGSSASGPDLSLYAPRGDELVPRKSDGALGHCNAPGAKWLGGGKSTGQGSAAGARRALLWAAVQLGLLAAALYSWAGVGASYFIPVAL